PAWGSPSCTASSRSTRGRSGSIPPPAAAPGSSSCSRTRRPDVAERLLIVDDEQSMREWLSIALSQDGFEVESAGSAEEGRKVLERTPVDLALVDLRMPGLDGLET